MFRTGTSKITNPGNSDYNYFYFRFHTAYQRTGCVMLTFSYTKSLAEYFRNSGSFYYFLIDTRGCFVYVNPLFQQTFNHIAADFYGLNAADVFFRNEADTFRSAFGQCLQDPDNGVQLNLTTGMKDATPCSIHWEMMACRDHENRVENIQAIGFAGEMVMPANSLLLVQERYRAFEHSAEGLWMFEAREPVPVMASPDEIVAYWRHNSHLAECNDNMAIMYGFEKAEELIGVALGDLLDFSDQSVIEGLKNFIRNGFKSRNVETKEFDRYGNTKYFMNSMLGIVENGKVKRIWGTQQDITVQRQTEQQLKQSELFYRNLIGDSLDGMLLTDDKGMINFVSPSVTKILGYEPEEIMHSSAFDYVYAKDRQLGITTFIEELKMAPRVKFISVRLRKKDGTLLWCVVRGHNLMDNPYVGRMVIYFADDTLRKKAEEAMMEGETRLRTQATILNNVTDVIVTTDLNRVVTSWNKVMERLSGITEEEAIGKPYRQVLDSDYSPYTHEQVAQIVFQEGIWRGEVSFIGQDGETKYLLHTVSLLQNENGESLGLLGVGKDITERKKIEARLQQSESFYRNLAAHSLDGIVITDEKGQITYCGPSVFELSGYGLDFLLGRNVFEFVHPDDAALAFQSFFSGSDRATFPNYIVIRLRHATRGWVWCTVRGHSLLPDPSVGAVVIYFTDDTKRKAVEDQLRESENKFRTLTYNLTQGVILLNERMEVILYNPAALTILGVTAEQLLSSTAFDPEWRAIYEDGRELPLTDRPVRVAIRTKKAVRDAVMGLYKPESTEVVWLLISADPILDNEGNIINIICSFTDITEQKRLSLELIEQEVQRQRLLTQATIDGQERERQEIGKELHDNINQHLTTTRLYLEVAKEKASGEVLEMIRLAHQNLSDIVNEIRHLSQSLVPPTLGDLGLVESVQELCDALKRAHSFQVEFLHRHFREEDLPDNLKLMIYRIIQEQVSNIIRHAQAHNVQIRLQSDAEYIILGIADDGRGFDKGNYKRGMGFSNITNRAGLFNGKVDIDAAPGQGCQVTVAIPVSGSTEVVS